MQFPDTSYHFFCSKIVFPILFFVVLLAFDSTLYAQQWSQIGLPIDGLARDDFSGRSVSLSGDGSRCAVGSAGYSSGMVRVFERNAGLWSQVGTNIYSALPYSTQNRVSLSKNGQRLAICTGAWNSGYVRVFQWINGVWTQIGPNILSSAIGPDFSQVVSLSANGNRLAILAPQNNNNEQVRVFDWVDTAWIQNGAIFDTQRGETLALSDDGNKLVVGYPYTVKGQVRVYELINRAWQQLGNGIDGEGVRDSEGSSVAISFDGSVIATGARFNSDGGLYGGQVRVFSLDDTAWVQVGNDFEGQAADSTGISISLSDNGEILAIGSSGNGDGGSMAGKTEIFRWERNAWRQMGNSILGDSLYDSDGGQVSLSSDGYTIAIGAHAGNSDQSGYTRVFEFPKPPVAKFDYILSQYGPGATYHFNDSSLANPTSWYWDFGDGNFSAQQSPQHRYAVMGTYQVCLTVSNPQGNDSVCKNVSVVVGSAPNLSFSFCQGQYINLASIMRDYTLQVTHWEFFDNDPSVGGIKIGQVQAVRGVARQGQRVIVSPLVTTTYYVRTNFRNGGSSTSTILATLNPNCGGTVEPIVALQGGWDAAAGKHRATLQSQGFLPQSEPYTSLGYSFTGGGGETLSATAQSNKDIVDWVIVELRDSTNPSQVIFSRAALLLRDGSIVDSDCQSQISAPVPNDVSYYLAVLHRNHLGVMTGQPVQLGTQVDFTNPLTATYGTGSARHVENGKAFMYAGDADGDGQIQNTDNVMRWMPQAGTSGYQSGDYNLDGQVQNSDLLQLWRPNTGRGSAVPR
jgi:PKD repeat protein